ncbi:MAG: hypothetical protein LBN29_14020 [Mediterranea sp.]|jgi:hypothetical protein|nr:hypothetical protein [Mediterranea sp.]
MKNVRFLTVTFALMTVFSVARAQSQDAFLTEEPWIGRKVGLLNEQIRFYTAPANSFNLSVYNDEGISNTGTVSGKYTLSGNTLTLKVTNNGGIANCPQTIKATLNATKTKITLTHPIVGGDATFTKNGTTGDNGGLQRPETQKIKKPKLKPGLNRPQQEANPAPKPRR